MGVSCSSGGELLVPQSSKVEVVTSPIVGVNVDAVLPSSTYITHNNNNHISSSIGTVTQSPSSTTCSLEVPVVVVMSPKNLNVNQRKQHDESLYSSGTISLAEFGAMHINNDRESAVTGTLNSMADIVTGSTLSTTATAFVAAHCSFGDSVDSRLPSRRQSHACGSLADEASQHQQPHIHRRISTDKPFSTAVPFTSSLTPKRVSSKSDLKSLSYLDQGRGARDDDSDDEDEDGRYLSTPPLTPLHSNAFATTPYARQLSEEDSIHNSNRSLPLYPPISTSEKISVETSQRGLEVSEISHLYLADSHSQTTNSQPSLPSVTHSMYSNTTVLPTSPSARSTLLLPLTHTPTTTTPHTTTTTPHHHKPYFVVSPLTSNRGSTTTSSIGQPRSSVSSAKKASSRLYEALQSGGSSCITSGSATPRSIRPLSRTDDDSGDAFGDGNMIVQDAGANTLQFRDNRLPSLAANLADDTSMSNTHSISSTLSTSTSSRHIIKRRGRIGGMMTPGTPSQPLNNLGPMGTEGIIFASNDDFKPHVVETTIEVEVSYIDDSQCGSSTAGSSLPVVVVPSSMGVSWAPRSLSKSAGGGGEEFEAPTPLNRSERHSAVSTNPDDDDDSDDDPLGGSAMPVSPLYPLKASCPFGSSNQNDDDEEEDESNPLGKSRRSDDDDDDDDYSEYDEKCSNQEDQYDYYDDDECDDDEGADCGLLSRLRLAGDSPTLRVAVQTAHASTATAPKSIPFTRAPPSPSNETGHHHVSHRHVPPSSSSTVQLLHTDGNDSVSTTIVVESVQHQNKTVHQ